jgi:hypothetical protein
MGRTAPHALEQASDQRQVTLRADFASQPQAGTDHHRQGHPHDPPLGLDADLIRLHLPQVAWLFNQMFLDSLPLSPGACFPRGHGPLVKPKGDDDRLQGTAVR